MLKGWLKRGLGPVVAVEPHPAPGLKRLKGVRFVRDIEAVTAGEFRACVVALKPQILKTEAARLAPIASRGIPMISIAAGTRIGFLAKAWSGKARILRAMPNTPGAIGKGITALCASKSARIADRTLAKSLLAPLGQTLWVGSEHLMDVTTAVSGSGPAYVFLLVEALAAAAMREGMPRGAARRLARATVTGAGALLDAEPRDPAELRRDVTSPGGTTEAALKVLMAKGGLEALILRAVRTATRRGGELARF